jgi:hypothetical protein
MFFSLEFVPNLNYKVAFHNKAAFFSGGVTTAHLSKHLSKEWIYARVADMKKDQQAILPSGVSLSIQPGLLAVSYL